MELAEMHNWNGKTCLKRKILVISESIGKAGMKGRKRKEEKKYKIYISSLSGHCTWGPKPISMLSNLPNHGVQILW